MLCSESYFDTFILIIYIPYLFVYTLKNLIIVMAARLNCQIEKMSIQHILR